MTTKASRDLSNKKFSELTVTEKWESRSGLNGNGNRYWLCKCSCGLELWVRATLLTAGRKQSCGCNRGWKKSFKQIEIGTKVNMLTTTGRWEARRVSNRTRVYWETTCECGNSSWQSYNKLIGHHNYITKSCGCTTKTSLVIPTNSDTIKVRYKETRASATKKKLPFQLTVEEFSNIIKEPCFWCGHKADTKVVTVKHKQVKILVNGIDRYDNDKGYIVSNCKPCCQRCNRMKSAQTAEEFLSRINKIAKLHGG